LFYEHFAILPFQVLSFSKSNCCDFIAKDEWPPIHPTLVHWIIMFGGSAGVLSQAATKPKIVSQFKCIAADLVRIATESH